jgi:signal transduction histidine kinase
MQKPAILIVDDEEKNIKLIQAMLTPGNYRLYSAADGDTALTLVHDIHPDLILMDVMMPGMDGFEVCRRLKADKSTRMIPVLMITALRDKEYTIASMEAGADDFLSKPVDMTELVVRVKSMLRIKAYHDELHDSYREIAQKKDKLQELERVKEGLTAMIIHDLNNPLMGISGNLQLLLLDRENYSESDAAKLETCLDYCTSMGNLIQSLLDIGRMEEGELKPDLKPADLSASTNDVLEMFSTQTVKNRVNLRFFEPEDHPQINVDNTLYKRVLANLIDNAIRHTPTGGDVSITIRPDPDRERICVTVRDDGCGLPAEFHNKIFNRFEQVSLKRNGVKAGTAGLGLNFCKLAVEAHGGDIWVESDGEGTGCAFHFALPV